MICGLLRGGEWAEIAAGTSDERAGSDPLNALKMQLIYFLPVLLRPFLVSLNSVM